MILNMLKFFRVCGRSMQPEVQDGDRLVFYTRDGKFIKAWGKHGSAPGEFDVPHTIALDSAGRVFVGDRSNSRIQIFDLRFQCIKPSIVELLHQISLCGDGLP